MGLHNRRPAGHDRGRMPAVEHEFDLSRSCIGLGIPLAAAGRRCYGVSEIHQGETVNLDHYKALLLAQERQLISRRAQTGREEVEPGDGAAAGDVGDESVKDEQKALLFTEDEADAGVLDDVRLALARIADGTYGLCVVDEQPIDEKRLEAIPWTKYCAKHQAEFEAAQGLRTPTL